MGILISILFNSPLRLLIRSESVISETQQENVKLVKIAIFFSQILKILLLFRYHLIKKIVGAQISTSPIANFYLATALLAVNKALN
jgi:hypothetical protein